MSTQEYLTVKELSQLIRISKTTIYDLVKDEKIPHIRIEGRIVFDKVKIKDWMDSQSKG
jgi:excisionase family DNA binding protein